MKTKTLFKKYFILLLLLVVIILGSFSSEHFLTGKNFLNIIRQMAVLACVSIGMSCVILSGNMDLSVGAILSFTGLIAISFQNYFSPFVSILFAILIGLILGAINGLIVSYSHANSGDSLMITFGTSMVISGFCLLYTKGFSLSGSSSDFFNNIGIGTVFNFFPISIVIVLICLVILSFEETKAPFGRYLHLLGYNPKASRLAGLPVQKTKILCFTISGGMAAIGAVILSARTLGATPTAGTGYEMDAIVAITLGGMSLAGGYGRIANTLIGVLILGFIGNIMNLTGFNANDQMIVKGVVLILAVTINTLNTKN